MLKIGYVGCLLAFLLGGKLSGQSLGKGDPDSLSLLKARIFYYENKVAYDSLDRQDRMEAMDSLGFLYSEIGRHDDLRRLQRETIDFLKHEGSASEAMAACQRYLFALQSKPFWTLSDSLQASMLELEQGVLSVTAGLYEESVAHLLTVLQYGIPRWCLTEAYSYLGYIFMRNDRIGKSKEYHAKALASYQGMESDSLKREAGILVYNHLGGLYYRLGRYDSAILCLEEAVACSDMQSESRLYSYHNMGLIYMELGEEAKAEEYLRKTMDLAGKEGSPYLHVVAMQNLAELYKEAGRYEESASLFTEALSMASSLRFNDVLANILIGYGDLRFHMGDCQGFRDYYMAGVAKRDSVTGAANQERIDLLNFQHESYRMASERKLLERDLALTHVSNQKKTVVVISLSLLLLLATLYTMRLIRKIRQQTQEYIHFRQQENDSRKLMDTSLEKKNRELASRALYMVQVDDVLKRVSEGLDSLKGLDEASRISLLEQMQSEIRAFNGNISGWKDFRFYFEQVHQDFYKRLLDRVPNLSPIEQRLCALLASNLTQKEIAEITNRSVRTIETMIYRIRKKFRLSPSVKISTFLQQFL